MQLKWASSRGGGGGFKILRNLRVGKILNNFNFLVLGGGGAGDDRTVHLMHIDNVIHQFDMERLDS